MSYERIIARQNSDGGWPYRSGSSWTEPTAYAILALMAAGQSNAARRGMAWLRSVRRPDGGWPPCSGVDESCWATALVALLPPEELGVGLHEGAVEWLLGVTGEESTWLYRLRQFLMGSPQPADQTSPGWPWIPRTAAWVGPTSLAMLALEAERKRNAARRSDNRLNARLGEGRGFLWNRMCRGGGWNHGSTQALGYPSSPYPETTGLALTALGGTRAAGLDASLALARRFLADCRSADAMNWLRLGLQAYGALPPGYAPPPEIQFRTVPELSLNCLIERGQGLL